MFVIYSFSVIRNQIPVTPNGFKRTSAYHTTLMTPFACMGKGIVPRGGLASGTFKINQEKNWRHFLLTLTEVHGVLPNFFDNPNSRKNL
jgi:hypothetical protein